MTFFRQFLHAKAKFSDRKYVSMSPKNSNLHAKIAQNWQIALFNYFCLSELFATLYSSAHVNSFWFAKFFAIKALMFTDDMVPNPFQVTFTLILTIGFKKGLNCSGVI